MRIEGRQLEYTWIPETRHIVIWDGRPVSDKERAENTWWVRFNGDGSWESIRGFWKQMDYRTRGKLTFRWVHP